MLKLLIRNKFILLFFYLILLFFNLKIFKINAFSHDFNFSNYEIDYNSKHNSNYLRHADGNAFTSKARVFYELTGIKTVPCRTYQEYANKAQIVKNVVGIASNFVPVPGSNKVIYRVFNPLLSGKIHR
ncbi:MAG: hypothetical protein Q8784_02370 [Vigna little leaf phytoplasma]|nr:hypothetical protein [Vigna little leaf phytoplasma]